jgi:hypothetical protein
MPGPLPRRVLPQGPRGRGAENNDGQGDEATIFLGFITCTCEKSEAKIIDHPAVLDSVKNL